MINRSIKILLNEDKLNYSSKPVLLELYKTARTNLFTVSIHTTKFVGRIFLEGTLSNNPESTDWFTIWLTESTPYIEFENNELNENHNNSMNTGLSFKFNVNQIRAKIDRSYLPNNEEYDLNIHGKIDYIHLNW